ncbi:MAG: HAMP domain-containing sensor histidine kinase [Desulfonauticus sp.]|nr:HAMP domain-containing sensor histidine kinase [Desulfonauticus sp.]
MPNFYLNLKNKSIPYLFTGIFIFILSVVISIYLYLLHNQLEKHLKMDAQETLSFIKERFLNYQQLVHLLKNPPPYLKNPAWLIDELQSHPILVGVLIWDKNKIILNSFPFARIPSKNIIENSKQGIKQQNLFYLSSVLKLNQKKLYILVAIQTDFQDRLWDTSLFISAIVFIVSLLVMGMASVFFSKLLQKEQQLSNQLLQSEKMAAAGRFSALLAHELKNPLNTLNMGLQVLKENPSQNAQMINILLKQITQLNLVVEDMLTLVRGIKPELTLIDWQDMAENIEELLHPLCTDKQVQLDIKKPKLQFKADRKWLKRALINLLKNAFEAVSYPEGQIVLNLRKKDNYVYFMVQDNGPGMDKQMLLNLFKPFYSTKKSGFGLGLYLAKEVAQAHGGDILVRNLKPKGLEVKLWIKYL